MTLGNDTSYTDRHGYKRGKLPEHSDLIHRQIAYKFIFLPNIDKYPLSFSEYVVHHIDHNKQNNDVSNLQILTQEEHEKIHGIIRNQEERLENYPEERQFFFNKWFAFILYGVVLISMIASGGANGSDVAGVIGFFSLVLGLYIHAKSDD